VTKPLVLRVAAEADIEDAFHWYEAQNPGLGVEFLRAVEVSLGSIEREPELYAAVHKRARRVLVRRFPYALYFVIQPQTIDVVGCFHMRRHPRRWRSRL
jgi:plasmid stabilization system protein ParE